MDIKEITNSWGWRIAKVGTTQQSIADEVGISRVHLNNCISGKSDPSIKVFGAIESVIKELEEWND